MAEQKNTQTAAVAEEKEKHILPNHFIENKGLLGEGAEAPDVVFNSALPIILAKILEEKGDELPRWLRGAMVAGSITPAMLYNIIPDLEDQIKAGEWEDAIMNGLTALAGVTATVDAFLPGFTDYEMLESFGYLNAIFQIVGLYEEYQEAGIERVVENLEEELKQQLIQRKSKSTEAADAHRSEPEVWKIVERDGQEERVRITPENIHDIKADDILEIGPDSLIPVDGEILAIYDQKGQEARQGELNTEITTGQSFNTLISMRDVEESRQRSSTGEATEASHVTPAHVVPQANFTAGNTRLRIKVSKSFEESSYMHGLHQLAKDAEEPKLKTNLQQYTGNYVKFIMAPAVALKMGWEVIQGFRNGGGVSFQEARNAIREGLSLGIKMAPCPVLAVPFAQVSANRYLLEAHNIQLRGEGTMEKFYASDTVVFDMTGTLTEGNPTLSREHVVSFDAEGTPIADEGAGADIQNDVILKAAALERRFGSHAVANAIHQLGLQTSAGNEAEYQRLIDNTSKLQEAEGSKHLNGGVSGIVDGRRVVVGNLAYMDEQSGSFKEAFEKVRPQLEAQANRMAEEGMMTTFSAIEGPDGSMRFSVMAAEDKIRDDAAMTLKTLHDAGKKLVLLTGDKENRANVMAAKLERLAREKLGLAEGEPLFTEVRGSQTPESKKEYIEQEQAKQVTHGNGSRRSIVAMVGDGSNDAPALNAADVSFGIRDRGAQATEAVVNGKITDIGDIGRMYKMQTRLSKTTSLLTKVAIGWMSLLTSTELMPFKIPNPIVSILHELPTALIMYIGAKTAHQATLDAFKDAPGVDVSKLEAPMSWEQARHMASAMFNALRNKVQMGDKAIAAGAGDESKGANVTQQLENPTLRATARVEGAPPQPGAGIAAA